MSHRVARKEPPPPQNGTRLARWIPKRLCISLTRAQRSFRVANTAQPTAQKVHEGMAKGDVSTVPFSVGP